MPLLKSRKASRKAKALFMIPPVLFFVSICSSSLAVGFQLFPKLGVSTDRRDYSGNATISVSGAITEVQGYVIVIITNPSGSPISSAYGEIDEYSGMYQVEFKAGGPGWSESGKYNVTAVWQFCPTSVSNSTSFMYAASTTGLNQEVSSTRLTATTTDCNSTTQSADELASSTSDSRGVATGGFPNNMVVELVVAVTVVILLTAAIVRRARSEKKIVR